MPTETPTLLAPNVETPLDSAPQRADSSHANADFPRRLIILVALLLFAGTFALYVPAISNGFVNFDDPDYVTHNPHVLSGATMQNIVWAFGTENPAGNWHPLTWISHMLDVQWYSLKPAGHHFTNVLLHSIDVALLFLVIALGTARIFRAAAVAALYGLHPLNVEAVAWVAERKAVLCMLFLFLAILAYGWYVRKPSVARYLAVFALFTLGLMSKAMVMALPIGLLLLDYWPLRRFADAEQSETSPTSLRDLILEKIPLLALSVAAGCMTLFVHHKEGTLTGSMPWSWRLQNVTYSYAVYLGKEVWPARLGVFYPHPENSLSLATVAVCGLLLVTISAAVWRLRAQRYLLMGWLWYVATMFPMIGFIQSGRQGMADRYMQLPALGILVAIIWFAADWAARAHLNRNVLAGSFALVAVPYILVSHNQIGYWRDSITLFTHTLKVTSHNGIAENNLGSAYLEKNQFQLAEPHFRSAVRIIPELASAHYNLAVSLHHQNRLDEAIPEYREAIRLASDRVEAAQAHNNLGILYLSSQNNAEAVKELSAAISLNPAEQNSYIGRGTIELRSLNADAAIADFTQAAQIAPSPLACFLLGQAFEAKSDFVHAKQAYESALQLAPQMTDAKVRLDVLRDRVRP